MSIARRVDLAVVGAGPAGCAAAITAARAGLSVVALDKAHFPRDKTCGDGLTLGALRRLETLGLEPSSVASFTTVDEIALLSPSGRSAHLDLRHGRGIFSAVARRRDLDHALVRIAHRSGVEVIEGVGFSSLSHVINGEVSLVLDDDSTISARHVVAADGAWSTLCRAASSFGAKAPDTSHVVSPSWYAMRAYLGATTEKALRRMWVSFGDAPLPGYAWSFPLASGAANVGVFVRTDDGRPRALKAAWNSFVEGPFFSSLASSDAGLTEGPRAWPIPTHLKATRLSYLDGAVLAVGDAAGAADPFTGEGIAQALHSGVSAASAIARAGRAEVSVAARAYENEIASGLAREHRIARVCSSVIAHDKVVRAIVAAFDRAPRLGSAVGSWLVEAYRRDLLVTPKAWRRGALSGIGAYEASS